MQFRRPKCSLTRATHRLQRFAFVRRLTCLSALALVPMMAGCQLGGQGFGDANGTLQPHRAFRQAVVAPGVQSYYRGPQSAATGGISSLYPAPVFGTPGNGTAVGQPFQGNAGFGARPPQVGYGAGIAYGSAAPRRRPLFGNVFGSTFVGGSPNAANDGNAYPGYAAGPIAGYRANPYQPAQGAASPFPPGYQAGPAANPYFSGVANQPAYTPNYSPGGC